MLTFRDQKTKKDMKIHLHAELEAHLLELPAPDRSTAPVFPKLAGKAPALLSKRFAKVLNRAGLANMVIAEARGPKGRRVFALSFHSTRHGFNTEMANAGVSQELRRKLTGHTSDAMNARYTHHEAEPLRAAVNAIPGLSRAGMKHKGTG
jgi:integrase